MLTVPELETLAHVDGTRTVQRLVKRGPLDPSQSARLLWVMASMGAIELTAEVHDVATPAGARSTRSAATCARASRDSRSRHTTTCSRSRRSPSTPRSRPRISSSARGTRRRRSAATTLPSSSRTSSRRGRSSRKRAACSSITRSAATTPTGCARTSSQLKTTWAIDVDESKAAAEAFARGQRALGEGDAHRAMGELARACRHHPDHPDYEAEPRVGAVPRPGRVGQGRE